MFSSPPSTSHLGILTTHCKPSSKSMKIRTCKVPDILWPNRQVCSPSLRFTAILRNSWTQIRGKKSFSNHHFSSLFSSSVGCGICSCILMTLLTCPLATDVFLWHRFRFCRWRSRGKLIRALHWRLWCLTIHNVVLWMWSSSEYNPRGTFSAVKAHDFARWKMCSLLRWLVIAAD